jgi:superfamily II DNA/RNA helicase
MLRNLGMGAVPIHGQMSQPKRLAALNKFKVGCGAAAQLLGRLWAP